jgi:predicted metal-dependent peptidase
MAMNVPDRVKKCTMAIMKHKKFCAYSGVIACGKVTFGNIPTARTDGWNVEYSEKFIREHCATDPELRFLILHENTHVAYKHLHMWKALWKEDARLANIAMDHFVNLSLVNTDAGEGFIKMLDVGIVPDQKYKGWSVKMIFDALKKEKEEEGKQPPGEPGEPGEGNGDGEGSQDEPGTPEEGEGEGDDPMDSHDFEGASEVGEKEIEKQAEEIERAIRQGEMLRRKLAGKGSGNADGAFGDLLNPEIDWKKVLRDFVTELCAGRDESSWRKPSRRFLGDDIIMPSMMGTTMSELVVLFDTSGSVFGGAEMTRFVSEIKTIVEVVCPKKIHVLYVDTRVCGHQTFEDGQFAVQALKVQGGGGTDLPVAYSYLQEKRIKPDAMVILTDGYTPFGTAPGYPVLWAMTTDMKAPYGVNIRVKV